MTTPSGPQDQSWREEFEELRRRFIHGARARMDELGSALDLLDGAPGDPSLLRGALQHFHKLAGAGATFGLETITALGRKGEELCSRCLLERTPVDETDRSECRRLLLRVEEEFAAAALEASRPTDAAPASVRRAAGGRIDVLVVEDDDDLRRSLTRLLERRGIAVREAATHAEALAAITERLPDAALVDIRLPDGSGYDVVARIRREAAGDGPPVLVISGRVGFLDKVEAIHCGADGYFTKPFECDSVVDRLAGLLRRGAEEPPRVLSVEDDPDQSTLVRSVLEAAGYAVHVCEDARDLEKDLIAFRPDVVLMDILMPGASGHDLVRAIRHDERFALMPVVFLSTEGQLRDRIRSTRAGGDDHLVKPVEPALLLATVAARVERARTLRALVNHDGLTGLLTHSAFLELAHLRWSELRRDPLRAAVLVMIDLDDFKAVNDRFGHPTGDRVLASLAGLLRRRLRQSDAIGRYGGEEFAVLLTDLEEDDAARLIRRVLHEFSETDHVAPDGQRFRVTFSAGAAVVDGTKPFRAALECADTALYGAKRTGRRQVTGASDS